MKPRPRLSAREAIAAGIFNTRPQHRKPPNAVPRRPKLRVDAEGRVTITTRRNLGPRPQKKVYYFTAASTRGKGGY